MTGLQIEQKKYYKSIWFLTAAVKQCRRNQIKAITSYVTQSQTLASNLFIILTYRWYSREVTSVLNEQRTVSRPTLR